MRCVKLHAPVYDILPPRLRKVPESDARSVACGGHSCCCCCSCVTTVARKRSWSFCLKCRWQVTVKHAYTLRMWLCMKRHVYMVYTELAPKRLQFHVAPAMRCKYTTSVDIQKTRYKKPVTYVEPHASTVILLKRVENSAV